MFFFSKIAHNQTRSRQGQTQEFVIVKTCPQTLSLQDPQAQPQLSLTQFKTQLVWGTGADTKS